MVEKSNDIMIKLNFYKWKKCTIKEYKLNDNKRGQTRQEEGKVIQLSMSLIIKQIKLLSNAYTLYLKHSLCFLSLIQKIINVFT